MKIIIAGAGAVGTHLAKLLSREHHDITLMDESPEKLEDLSSNFDILDFATFALVGFRTARGRSRKSRPLYWRYPRRSPQHDGLYARIKHGSKENRGPCR